MRSQVSSLQQNGLTFGIPNMRGNWNSLMGGCAVIGLGQKKTPAKGLVSNTTLRQCAYKQYKRMPLCGYFVE